MEYYLATKKELLTFATAGMKLEDIVQVEEVRARQVLYDLNYRWNLKKIKGWLPAARRWGIREMLFKGPQWQLVDKNILEI